jgi:integrase
MAPGRSFTTNRNQFRADDAWEKANFKERKLAAQEGRDPIVLEQITLHSCRHTFASLMIAAGINAKALSTFMGHANISITLDRYGHLMPGSEAEAADLLDAYLSAQRVTGMQPQCATMRSLRRKPKPP